MELRNTFLLYHMLIFIQNEPKKTLFHILVREEKLLIQCWQNESFNN